MYVRFFILFIVISITYISPAAYARHLYVSTKGQPHFTGSKQEPFTSIQQSVDRAAPGDTIHIEPGVYRESVVLHHGGTATAPITIMGAGRNATTLDGAVALQGVWEQCDRRLFRLPVPDEYPETLLLWEGDEQLTAVDSLHDKAGTYYVGAPDPKRAAATPHCANAAAPVTPPHHGRYLYLRPLHPRRSPEQLSIMAALRAPLIATAPGTAVHHVVIRDLGIRRSAQSTRGAIDLEGATHWTLRRLLLQYNGSVGIRAVHTAQLTIAGCEITRGQNASGGLAISGGHLLTIRHNYIHDNSGSGITITTDSSATIRILDNVLRANADDNIVVTTAADQQCTVPTTSTLIQGNVIMGAYTPAGPAAHKFSGGVTMPPHGTVHVRENLFVGNQHALLLQEDANTCNTAPAMVMENMLLYSFGAHMRTTLQRPTDIRMMDNVYSEGQRRDFLTGLFFGSHEVRQDPLFQHGAGTLLALDAMVDNTPQLLTDLLQQIPWLQDDLAQLTHLDPDATIQRAHSIVLHGQLPFVYTPPPLIHTPDNAHLVMVRLAGGRGSARLQLHMLPHGTLRDTARAPRVTWNGRIVPVEPRDRGTLTGTMPISPWQNWLVVSVPHGWALDLLRVQHTPSRLARN